MIINLDITKDLAGARLDDALASLAGISKGEARRIIDRGGCVVSGAMVRVASRQVKITDKIVAGIMEPGRFQELVLPDDALIYEDDDLLAVNKPSGVPSQRTPYQLKGTIEYWISEQLRMRGSAEPARVVHRLDRGTSGVMVFPKHRQSAAWLSELFKNGEMKKTYLAVVTGAVSSEKWVADGPIGKVAKSRYGVVEAGRTARTEFCRISSDGIFTLVEAVPVTGRTHQIRVHLSAAGLPIAGDTTYGGVEAPRLMLHCSSLSFKGRGGNSIELKAAPDAAFQDLLRQG